MPARSFRRLGGRTAARCQGRRRRELLIGLIFCGIGAIVIYFSVKPFESILSFGGG